MAGPRWWGGMVAGCGGVAGEAGRGVSWDAPAEAQLTPVTGGKTKCRGGCPDSPSAAQPWPLLWSSLAAGLGISVLRPAHPYHQKPQCGATGEMYRLGHLPIQMEKRHEGTNKLYIEICCYQNVCKQGHPSHTPLHQMWQWRRGGLGLLEATA